jgi:hypothetical protein
MGKRSRKRGAPADDAETRPHRGSSRAERDAARARRAEAARKRSAAATPGRATSARARRRRGRPTIDERPPAPWGNFPLVELVVLLALILLPLSFVIGGTRGNVMLTAALALGSLAGLELSIREHLAGYRSHTTLLAGACAFVSMAIVFFAGGRGDVSRALMIPVGGLVFVGAFWFFREVFKRRSGGLGFR